MTDLLLDTNVVLWFLNKDSRLGSSVLETIQKAPLVFVSAVSVWEIAIKRGKGKLTIVPDYVDYIAGSGFLELQPSFAHARRIETLPPIHSDPFDRMLVAQALCEGLTIVTGDRNIQRYDIKTVAA